MPFTTTISGVQTFLVNILDTFGVPSTQAELISEVVMDSELRGHWDHGVAYFLSVVLGSYRNGLNPAPEVRVVQDGPAVTLLDGDGGIGVIGSSQAMDRCIEKAGTVGIAAAGVVNSVNFIAGAPYVERAANAGFVAFICSNVPVMSPPTGGLTKTFGTNPLAYAAPAGNHPPMVIDIATTAIAGAKIMVARRSGETLDSGLLMHPDGRDITDPADFDPVSSLLLPMAGAKGYGLMMMVDVLAGVMTGAQFGPDLTFGPGGPPSPDNDTTRGGQFMWVIDPAQFMPREEFLSRMDQQMDQIKAGERMKGVDEIFVPGERGMRHRADLLATGNLQMMDPTWNAMESVANEKGVPLPDLV